MYHAPRDRPGPAPVRRVCVTFGCHNKHRVYSAASCLYDHCKLYIVRPALARAEYCNFASAVWKPLACARARELARQRATLNRRGRYGQMDFIRICIPLLFCLFVVVVAVAVPPM